MALPVYLAMTASELLRAKSIPDKPAWMACHFSCYGLGLSNFPPQLPEGAMLILSDCIPIRQHNPNQIAAELTLLTEKHAVGCVLLDFQRPQCPALSAVAKLLTRTVRVPIAVTPHYAKPLNCAVFLPPPAPHKPLAEHLHAWCGRDIWLEAALENQTLTVTPGGTTISDPAAYQPCQPSFENEKLHCRYHTHIGNQQVVFTLFRTRPCLQALLNEAEQLGVSRAVGLYQQLGDRI